MKIKVKLFNKECKFEFIKKGEWIDLYAAEDVVKRVRLQKSNSQFFMCLKA